MPRRLLYLAVLAAIVAGGVLAWRSGAERARLEERYRHWARTAGDLAAVDPTKVYVLGLETDEPLHFAWRLHAPANYRASFAYVGGGGSGSSGFTTSTPSDFIARVRIRRDEAGRLQVFERLGGASGVFAVEDDLGRFLAGREGELIVEPLAADGPVAFDASTSVTLLRVAMPPAMIEEARAKLPDHVVARHVPDVVKITVGPPRP